MNANHPLGLALPVLIALVPAASALAQHEGDVWLGMTSAGQVRLSPPEVGGFDPLRMTAFLEEELEDRFTDDRPGFDGNVESSPEHDFYSIFEREGTSDLWLVAVSDPSPALTIRYTSRYVIDEAGESLPLGADVHRHVIYRISKNESDGYDPIRVHWSCDFVIEDRGSTGLQTSAPFTMYFSTVKCLLGDVNQDAEVNFDDIDPFVVVLTDPAAASVEDRCAADADRDGYVTFDDIDAFVALLLGN
jgi:hypothetical protein